MKKTSKLLFPLLLFSLALPVFAQSSGFSVVTCGPGTGKVCTPCELFHTAQNLLKLLVDLGFTLSFLGIAYGGVLLMISAGNEGRFKQGKDAIGAAVIGLVIVLSSWLIVNTVLNLLGNHDLFKNWNQINCQ